MIKKATHSRDSDAKPLAPESDAADKPKDFSMSDILLANKEIYQMVGNFGDATGVFD